MRAIDVLRPGGSDQLVVSQVDLPVLRPGQVLIKVAACGVNRPDLLQRKGFYPPPAEADPRLGLEVSGKIVKLADDVNSSWLDQSVMALCNGGGYAEFVAVPVGQCMPIPPGVSLTDAASLPETYLTVWQNLFDSGQLASGMHVLIHGGSSGIGCAAIQLAAAHGAQVHVTVGSNEKATFCQSLGAHYVYNYQTQDWVTQVLHNVQSGVHLILDMVAGAYIQRDLNCLAVQGKIFIIALMGGRTIELDGAQLLKKQGSLCANTLRSQTLQYKAQLVKKVSACLNNFFTQGLLKTTVTKRFNLIEVSLAHDLIESGRHMGKIVLEV